MYDLVIEKGWLRVTDFDKYDTVKPIFETPELSMKELGKIRAQAFHHFYLRPAYYLDKKRRFKVSTALVVLSNILGSVKIWLS
jgi:hypothetical protein